MITIDEDRCSAPPEVSFRIAADVERWPEILPHYRWVRFHREDGFARGRVEMAAWRPFGPVKYPTWWVSEMDHRSEERRIFYHHVDGITRGMKVRWEVDGSERGGSRLRIVHEWEGPPWPLVGSVAADHVIGPHFVSHIAGRTLAGICREAERRAAEGPDRGRTIDGRTEAGGAGADSGRERHT